MGLETCSRCGFVFPKEVRADVRDSAILGKHAGKSVEKVNRDLRNARAQLTAYLDNMAAKRLSREEMATLTDEALAFLQIPLSIGVDDELRLNSQEREFVNLIVKNLEAADLENNGPVGTSGAYTRLSNALQSMGEQESAMRMIEKALLLRPKDMDAMFAKAKLLFYSKKYAQARKSLEKIISAGGHENAMYLVELIDQISNS